MKIKHAIGAIAGILVFGLTGCGDLDNYEGPNGGIRGKVVDLATGKNIPQPVNASTGLKIHLVQQDWVVEAEAQFFYGMLDGTFTNTTLFNGAYTMELEQTNFFPVDKQLVTIQGQTEVVVEATPYANAELTDVSVADRTVNARIQVGRSWKWQSDDRGCKLTKVLLYWNASKQIDKESTHNLGSVTVACDNREDADVLGTATAVSLDITDNYNKYAHIIRSNGNKIYVRAAVVTKKGGAEYYNYSEPQELVLK